VKQLGAVGDASWCPNPSQRGTGKRGLSSRLFPQLMTYAKAIEMAGRVVIGRFVHFTVGGGMAELVERAHVGDALAPTSLTR
jgi:hypothetical protein